MRNFARINGYFNNLQAWEDWRNLAAQYPELAAKFAPLECASWRKVDAALAKLRTAIRNQEVRDAE